MLEDAARLVRRRVLARGYAVPGDHHQLTRQHVALEFCTQQIEGAGFRGEDYGVGSVGIGDATHRERPESVRIAGRKDAIARHHDDREGALDLAQRVGNGVDEGCGLGMRDELDDDFRVRCGLEECAFALQMHAQVAKVHQVAVVRDRNQAFGRLHADGLRIEQRRVAGGRIARVPDGHVAFEARDHIVGEDLGDEAHALNVRKVRAVCGGDAGGFLAAMLEGVEGEVGLAGCVGVIVDGDYATFFVELV